MFEPFFTGFACVLIFSAGCITGHSMGQEDVARDCRQSGESQIGNTYYSCEPVGALVDGQRKAFKAIWEQ